MDYSMKGIKMAESFRDK